MPAYAVTSRVTATTLNSGLVHAIRSTPSLSRLAGEGPQRQEAIIETVTKRCNLFLATLRSWIPAAHSPLIERARLVMPANAETEQTCRTECAQRESQESLRESRRPRSQGVGDSNGAAYSLAEPRVSR